MRWLEGHWILSSLLCNCIWNKSTRSLHSSYSYEYMLHMLDKHATTKMILTRDSNYIWGRSFIGMILGKILWSAIYRFPFNYLQEM